MKMTSQEFQVFLKKEVVKILSEEIVKENNIVKDFSKKEEILTINNETSLKEEFEVIEPKNEVVKEVAAEIKEQEPAQLATVPVTEAEAPIIKEVGKLNEELKRMKQLVDFRSPLLVKD